MKPLCTFLPLLLTMSNCGGDCKPVALAPDDRAWFTGYQAGQTLTFRSNRGATMTATVQPLKEWHENQNCNKLEAGPYQPIFVQNGAVFAPAIDAKYSGFTVNIRQNRPDSLGQMVFNVAGLECSTTSRAGVPTAKLRTQAVRLSSGKEYPTAYVFRNGQNAQSVGGSRVQAFFWDKQDGLIRYELTDGEIFELTSR